MAEPVQEVHGLEGLDELSILGPSIAFEVRSGDREIEELEIEPASIGLPPADPESIRGGDPEENARWIQALLDNEVEGGSRDMVVLNTSAALLVGGAVDTLPEGRAKAEEALASGAAAGVLAQLRETTQKL